MTAVGSQIASFTSTTYFLTMSLTHRYPSDIVVGSRQGVQSVSVLTIKSKMNKTRLEKSKQSTVQVTAVGCFGLTDSGHNI